MDRKLFEEYWHMLLYDSYGHQGMILGFHTSEVRPIVMGMRGLGDRSREAFVLLNQSLKLLGAKMDCVQLTGDLDGGPLRMNVKLRRAREVFEITCGPAVAIAAAVQQPAPIYISNEMMRRFAFLLPEESRGSFSEEKGIELILEEIKSDQRAYEERLVQLNQRAIHKTDQAYAISSQKVFDYLFSKRG